MLKARIIAVKVPIFIFLTQHSVNFYYIIVLLELIPRLTMIMFVKELNAENF